MNARDDAERTESVRRDSDETLAKERRDSDEERRGERGSLDGTRQRSRGGRQLAESLGRERLRDDERLRRERERSDSTRQDERVEADESLLQERVDRVRGEANEVRRSARRREFYYEVQAVLAAVSANVGTLVEDSPADELGRHLRECAERAEQATKRAMELVAQLLLLDDDA